MKDDFNLSGIEEPEPSWWDDIRFGLGPFALAAFALMCVVGFVFGLLNLIG